MGRLGSGLPVAAKASSAALAAAHSPSVVLLGLDDDIVRKGTFFADIRMLLGTNANAVDDRYTNSSSNGNDDIVISFHTI